MSEEEKEAIEFLKKRINEWKKYTKRENETTYDDVVLNLIEKLQKENESLKQEITVLQNTKDTCPEFNSSGVRCNLKQENEELKGLIAHKNGYTKKLEEDLFENCSNYVVSVQKIKDKIEKEKLPLVIIGGRKNKKTLEYGIKLGRRQALRELIEEREDK